MTGRAANRWTNRTARWGQRRPTLCSFALLFLSCLFLHAADKNIIFIAGGPSHAAGEHEYRAGCLLLKKCLDALPGINSVVHSNGWPKEASALNDAAAIIIYSDGGPRHPVLQNDHRKILGRVLEKGAGLGCIHFAVEIPRTNGGPEFLQWVGGYYEVGFSINPVWTPEFFRLPDHPIARGVKTFSLKDEWYFNIRFPADQHALIPILFSTPSDKVRLGPYRDRYPEVEKNFGRDETLMWALKRPGPNDGRSFGFTGGHFHKNWGDANFRKLVLNAILWIAKAEISSNGVQSVITEHDLSQNLDEGKNK